MKKKPITEKAVNFVRVYPADYEKLRALAFQLHLTYPEVIKNLLQINEKQGE